MAGQVRVKSGKTFRYQAITENFVGCGTHGRVFKGRFKPNIKTSWEEESDKEKNAAIKRVEINYKEENWMDIENDREVVALKELRHPYIVRLFAVEDDDNFRNYVFELCQANLEDFITKKYDRLMPDETEGLYQMASGLKFIHEKNMIHRDIKPENVLVYLPEGGQSAWLKISDLGFTKPLKEDGIHYDLASGLKGTEYYMAPELLFLKNLKGSVLDKDCTIATDVFSAGCTFFRYLNGGLHPFGKGYNIEVNIMEGKPINATKYEDEPWRTNLIAEMVKFNPKDRLSFSNIVEVLKNHLEALSSRSTFPSMSGDLLPVIIQQNENYDKTRTSNVGGVEYSRSNPIGQGGYGVVFFAGTFKGEKVAVKRVQLMDSVSYESTEVFNNKILLNHPNIVQFKHYVEDDDYRYFVFELCAASLSDFIYGKYQGPMPTDKQVLFQLANGLEYIHSRNILHRGVTPENILISSTKPVQMKYSDFGLKKPVNENGYRSLAGMQTKLCWLSPEELRIPLAEYEGMVDDRRGSVKSDIFSAGCVFIYFLLRGLHPFGPGLIKKNIMKGRPVNVKALPEEHFARPFVLQMIANDPERRISLREVIDQLEPLQPAIQLSMLQYDNQNMLCSTGTPSLVYRVGKFEGSSLAVKRVPLQDCTTKSFEELKPLNHSNIIRFHHFEESDLYKYFGMELCVASLDQLFLPEDDPKKYKGPIPSDEQFCFQLISGLEYIHKKNLIHGSIKPTNILISSSQDPQIKLSDFGLTTSFLNEGHTTKNFIRGFLSSRYWLAPELLESESCQFTKESDIFAAGSVFFYFLSKGCHLFGDATHEIIKNTSEGIHANIFCNLSKIVFPSGLIRWMTSKVPGDRPKLEAIIRLLNLNKPLSPKEENPKEIREIGDIRYSVDHLLERGGQGNVFIGKWKDSEVAVKRISDIDTLTADKRKIVDREREHFEKLDHRNIVKLLSFHENDVFLVLALEKCLISLHDYCCVPQLYHGIVPMPSKQEVLLEMAKGLEYIHLQDLIHRDVKPKNILISHDNPAVIKWADFGMSRAVVTGSKTFSWSKLQGTDRWLAPELIEAPQEEKIRGSQKCDIFSLGCVFFFFLVPGVHPFGSGDDHSTKNNIKDDKQVNFVRLPKGNFAFDIIKGMIENDREKRPKLPDVVKGLSTIVDSATKACCIKLFQTNTPFLNQFQLKQFSFVLSLQLMTPAARVCDDLIEMPPPVKKPKKDDD